MIASPVTHAFITKKSLGTPFIPPIMGGLLMLVDINAPNSVWTNTSRTSPANIGDAVGGVTDRSGNSNHWSQAAPSSAPILQIGTNGKRVLRFPNTFPGTYYMTFATELTTIRTVYWAANEDPTYAAGAGGYNFLLGHSSQYNFHADTPHQCFAAYSTVYELHIDKANVATNATRPTSLKVITALTYAASYATEFSRDRVNNYGNRAWCGDLALLLIYDSIHSAGQTSTTEDAIKTHLGI